MVEKRQCATDRIKMVQELGQRILQHNPPDILIILVLLPSPLLIQLINDLLSTRKNLKGS